MSDSGTGEMPSRAVAVRLDARAVRNRTRESLFFVPTVLIVAGGIAAVAAAMVDRALRQVDVPRLLQVPTGSAETLLTTIAGATITAVSVVFSITVVSVQLASGQFSPRVVRGFFRDRYAQTTIGVLAATFAFCVLSLYGIGPTAQSSGTLTPVAATAGAVLLALASIVTIVIYLDHSARALYVGRLADNVMDESIALVDRLANATGEPAPEPPPDAPGHVVNSRGGSGWVQQISYDGVLAATPPGTTVRLETRPGAYVTTGTPIAVLWPTPADPVAVETAVNRAVVLGAERTMQEDLDFGLRQLNDIALRALSPAVNDPTTAIEVIVRLGSILHELLGRDLPSRDRTDGEGRALHNPLQLEHADYVRHAFLQLRRAVVQHPVVSIAYVRTLRMLALTAAREQRAAAAETAERMIAGCLELSGKAGLLDDEQEMLVRAARAESPSAEHAETPADPPGHRAG